MNGKFECAFFDFDGVIVDSEPIRMDTYKNLFLEVYGVDIDIDKYSMVGKSENHNLANLLKINNLDNDQKTILDLKTRRLKMLISEAQKGLPIIESVMRIIKALKRMNIEIAIVTNSSYDYIIAALDGINLDKNCFHITTRDHVSFSKPHPEIYLKTLKSLACNSKNALAFEDSLCGIEAAKSAGLETVAVHSTFDQLLLKSNYHLDLDKKNNRIMEIVSLFGKSHA